MNNSFKEKKLYLVSEDEKEQRVDLFLASHEAKITRSRIQSLIKNNYITVNDQPTKAAYKLKLNDKIIIKLPEPEPSTVGPEPVDFSVIFEDPWIIVLDKPPGIVIHPAPGHLKGTLVHGLLHHCSNLSGIGGILRPGIVHRLDKDTSGVLVVAKNDFAHANLSLQFKNGTINKKYIALIHGVIPGQKGEVDLPISRHPTRRKEMAVSRSKGRAAITIWNKIEVFGGKFSLLDITLKTGRTHQIRVHLSHIGFPVVGDPVYGYRNSWWNRNSPEAAAIVPLIKRQLLHSAKLGLHHPETGEYLEFKSAPPPDMEKVVKGLKNIYDN